MKTLTESDIQRAYIDDVFADGNADQTLLARIERGLAFQRRLRDREQQRTLARCHGSGTDGEAA